MEKKHTWFKVVATIIVLELLVGGVFYAYKKLKSTPEDQVSVKDKVVLNLYEKIAYDDFDILDIMSNDAILYYAYHNVDSTESINCDVLAIEKVKDGYECSSLAPFVKKENLLEAAYDLYGPNLGVNMKDFAVDADHYAYYDEENQGVVIFTRTTPSEAVPVNFQLKKAEKEEDYMILTVDVLDGIYGTVQSTYKYTFEQKEENYFLIKREKVTE